MNISYKWLQEYIDVSMTATEVAEALTSIGLEVGSVERVESIKGGLRGLVVGKVLTCEAHPDSDHLHITTVDLGDGAATQIVCGAPNVAAGQTVIVATVGTTLYDGDKEFKIKKSKIRGVESFGMICAEDEIGVGMSHDGIIVIEGANVPAAGTPAAEYYNLTDDYVIEVDLTPNRIDAASHYGVARDLAAWCAARGVAHSLKTAEPQSGEAVGGSAGVRVRVEDSEACIRYSGVTIDGVEVKESPAWLKERLTTIGLRPINNVVDITNYILHGYGQPLHCFDRSKIKGDEVVVRKSKGEKFVTLDEVERTLSTDDLMICNVEEPMCIAGVFGGLHSGVTAETKSVFLESACFHPTSVRKTARRHGLSTDSSFRFERGVDPNGTMKALRLAAAMVLDLAGGKIVGEFTDIYPNEVKPYPVTLGYKDIDNLLGAHLDENTVDTILNALEIEVKEKKDGVLSLAVPTYRVDVQRPCDVIEDILRIYGYNNIAIPQTLHASLNKKTATDAAEDLRHLLADCLSGAGLTEILNNSLTAGHYYEGLDSFKRENCVELLNPLSRDLNVMRQTLLFGGLETAAHNINRRSGDLAMYEFGNVYSYNGGHEPEAENALKPYKEGARLGIWLTGDIVKGGWNRTATKSSAYDLKGLVNLVLTRAGYTKQQLAEQSEVTAPDLYSTQLTVTTRQGAVLASIGEVSPKVLGKFDIKQPVYFAEMDFDKICADAAKMTTKFAPLPKTQAVHRDLSLLIDKAVTMAQVEGVIRQSEKRLLRDVSLFDVYEGKDLPAGKKSYAVSIALQDNEKTLNDKVTDEIMRRVITNLEKELNAQLR